MKTVLKMNNLNQLEKDAVLFEKGRPIRCIGALIQGSVRIEGGGMSRIARKGSMLAVSDLFFGQYTGNYIVEENAVVYTFSVTDTASLGKFLEQNADYRGIIVHSIAGDLLEYLNGRERLLKFAAEVRDCLDADDGKGLAEEWFTLECEEEKLASYRECASIPLDIHKKYYYNGLSMGWYQTKEIAGMIKSVFASCQLVLKKLDEVYWNATGELFDEEEEASFGLDALREMFAPVLHPQEHSAESAQEEALLERIERPMEVLKDSLMQILRFSGLEKKGQNEIIDAMNAFVNAKDRLSTQDDMRKVKKQITTYFFKLYENCVFKWFKDQNVPLVIRLFLNYGYMDERLLEEDQIRFLCDRIIEKEEKTACRIYTMAEWLREIYEGRKEPSRNSFEQDYRDALREDKRTGKITEKQEKEYLEDNVRKVRFELENMFVSNNKIVNGKLSTYVPVLYSEEIFGHMDRLYLSKQKLSDVIVELERKDFTIFQREVLYTNPKMGIEKEYVLKHVYPDVILAPVYGTASSMWQEITGKKRDTPGRFIFPVLTENEVDTLVTKAFGRFHWEYCRCEQGASWNNIQYKSLTSEYMDYIQYYRKNRDLTEEKREKIKAQILKARNNSREIFLIDYELWMYYESKAAIKMNKVARLILATYCPFNKEIREMLKTNAAFAEALTAHQKIFGEKKREWEMRIKRRENKNLEIPQEFYNTYEYYANN